MAVTDRDLLINDMKASLTTMEQTLRTARFVRAYVALKLSRLDALNGRLEHAATMNDVEFAQLSKDFQEFTEELGTALAALPRSQIAQPGALASPVAAPAADTTHDETGTDESLEHLAALEALEKLERVFNEQLDTISNSEEKAEKTKKYKNIVDALHADAESYHSDHETSKETRKAKFKALTHRMNGIMRIIGLGSATPPPSEAGGLSRSGSDAGSTPITVDASASAETPALASSAVAQAPDVTTAGSAEVQSLVAVREAVAHFTVVFEQQHRSVTDPEEKSRLAIAYTRMYNDFMEELGRCAVCTEASEREAGFRALTDRIHFRIKGLSAAPRMLSTDSSKPAAPLEEPGIARGASAAAFVGPVGAPPRLQGGAGTTTDPVSGGPVAPLAEPARPTSPLPPQRRGLRGGTTPARDDVGVQEAARVSLGGGSTPRYSRSASPAAAAAAAAGDSMAGYQFRTLPTNHPDAQQNYLSVPSPGGAAAAASRATGFDPSNPVAEGSAAAESQPPAHFMARNTAGEGGSGPTTMPVAPPVPLGRASAAAAEGPPYASEERLASPSAQRGFPEPAQREGSDAPMRAEAAAAESVGREEAVDADVSGTKQVLQAAEAHYYRQFGVYPPSITPAAKERDPISTIQQTADAQPVFKPGYRKPELKSGGRELTLHFPKPQTAEEFFLDLAAEGKEFEVEKDGQKLFRAEKGVLSKWDATQNSWAPVQRPERPAAMDFEPLPPRRRDGESAVADRTGVADAALHDSRDVTRKAREAVEAEREVAAGSERRARPPGGHAVDPTRDTGDGQLRRGPSPGSGPASA